LKPTPEELDALVAEHGSNRRVATHLGVDESTVRRWRRAAGRQSSPRSGEAPKPERASFTVAGDEATIVSQAGPELGKVGDLIRENGLDPEEWEVVSTTVNRWEALAYGGGPDGEPRTVTLRQVKVTLKRRPTLQLLSPARHVPALVRPRATARDRRAPRHYIVEGDHQLPYNDPELDACATALVADLQPERHVFLGDTLDLPTISRHDDHPAATATPQECIDEGYALLRRRAEAAPNARRQKLLGNHDWRLQSELLKRAERMYGLREDVAALSLRRLLQMDALGVELVEHPLGFSHAEVELIEGTAGLVVRHGWITGANTAARSLRKRGRSLIVGHTHSREHAFVWDPSAGVERQALVAGTMSLVRSRRFPHFAPCDDWLQGLVVVTHWPDGGWIAEHAVYSDGALYWRDRRYTARGRQS
jgi:hypothetical protein